MSRLGVEPVALAGDLFPRVVRVGEAGLGVGVMLGLERLGDPDERLAGRPGRGIPCPAGSRPARPRYPQSACRSIASAVRRSRKIGRSIGAGDLVGQAGEAPVAVRPRQPLGLADLHLAEDDLVAAQGPSPPCRPGRRPGGRSPTRPPRRPARYRKAECRRGKAAGRPAARSRRRRSRTRAGPARRQFGQIGLGEPDLDPRPHHGLAPAAPRAVDRHDQLALQRQRRAAPPRSPAPPRTARPRSTGSPAAARPARDTSRGSGSRRGTAASSSRTGWRRR